MTSQHGGFKSAQPSPSSTDSEIEEVIRFNINANLIADTRIADLVKALDKFITKRELAVRVDEHNLTKRHYHPDNDPAKFEAFLADRIVYLTKGEEEHE